jgi:hypothetical protein
MYSSNSIPYSSNFLTSGSVDQYGDPDIVYYNADIISSKTTKYSNNTSSVLKFQEVRAKPIINNISNFDFSIIRANLNGANKYLPLFIPQILTNQTNVNLTTYSVGIAINKAGAVFYANAPIIYIPEDLTAPKPKEPLKNQDLSSSYYYITNYDYFCQLVNTALLTAFNAVKTASSYAGTCKAPYIQYDPLTQLFSFFADSNGFGYADSTDQGNLFFPFFNDNLYNLFSSFNEIFCETIPQITGGSSLTIPSGTVFNEKYYLQVYSKNKSNTYVTGGITYYSMLQNFITTSSLWCPVSSIVMTTTLLPVFAENVSQPVIYGDDNNNAEPSTSSNNFTNMIADFIIPIKNASDYLNNILYEPTGEFKMTSITCTSGVLNSIDIQCFWRNRLDNELYPIKMPNFSNATVKMLFRKRFKNNI